MFVCLLLNGTSALFRHIVPRIVELEHTSHVKNDVIIYLSARKYTITCNFVLVILHNVHELYS